jgi:hypothetical protein
MVEREGSSWSQTRPSRTKHPKSVLSASTKLKPEGAIHSKRMKILKEIFDFYGKQQSLLGKSPTFEQIGTNLQQISLGEFLKFCTEF